jgi:hypothetical protein
MFRYKLRTLLILLTIGPPIIAFAFLHWGLALFLAAFVVGIWLWIFGTLALARLIANVLVSPMD